jgi:hypothetical protein
MLTHWLRRMSRTFVVVFSLTVLPVAALLAADFPPIDQLPSHPELPDPLVMFDGTPVTSKTQWINDRRPELKALIQHYMYGYLPKPTGINATVQSESNELFGGKAIRREVDIQFGPRGTPPFSLLVVLPRNAQKPVPCFVGINFCGNHTVLNDPGVALPKSWLRDRCPGGKDNRATDAGRGKEVDVWNIEMIIDRGYGIAMFYYGDVDPDKQENDFTDGVHPHFFKPGQTEPGKHDWGAIAAWAYAVHRAVDYLETDKAVDAKRIGVVGHSRLGKTAILAAALDERIALAIPLQAGCGGTAPSRGIVGEPVERINNVFPHWFNDTFPEFNRQVEKIPFDQHSLVALCAPRPVLFPNAVEDQWANPDGQFDVLKAASPVYQFLGVEGLGADKVPEVGTLLNSRLGYFIREGKHSMTTQDWGVFLDFADKHLK